MYMHMVITHALLLYLTCILDQVYIHVILHTYGRLQKKLCELVARHCNRFVKSLS